MSEINYTFRHNDFNLTLAYYYTLVLHVSRNSFTYAVFYEDKLMALAPDNSLEELANPTEIADEIFANFKDIVVGVDAEAFTLVPAALYQEAHVAEYARFLNVDANERVFSQQLDAENFIVYKTSEYIAAAIEKFDYNRCVYSSKGWINTIASQANSNNCIYINIEEEQVEVLYLTNGKIRLYNTFECSTANDLAYVVSLVFRETGLNQKDVSLSLSGTATQMADYRARLADFFNDVESNITKIADLPEELSSGELLKLSALLLCVSSEAS